MFTARFGDQIDYRVTPICITVKAALLPRFVAITAACSGSSLVLSASIGIGLLLWIPEDLCLPHPGFTMSGFFLFFFLLVFLPIPFICRNVLTPSCKPRGCQPHHAPSFPAL